MTLRELITKYAGKRTAAQIAAAAGVQESTVRRLASRMGVSLRVRTV
jgi:DNA-binding MurR/RpiR family transcriptional regulator